MGRPGRAAAHRRPPVLALAPSATAIARHGGALAGGIGASRPLGVTGAAARHAPQRLDNELRGRRKRRVVRCRSFARPGAARHRPVRRAQDHTSYPGAAADRRADPACRRRRTS